MASKSQSKNDENEAVSQFDIALENVKSKAYYLSQEIEGHNLDNILNYSYSLLSELKSNCFDLEQYSTLYSMVFDETHFLRMYFKEEAKAQKIDLLDLYENVQHYEAIVPRFYLMTIIGIVISEEKNELSYYIIIDLMKFVQGIKSVIKGLYCRYFFVKVFKDFFFSIFIKNCNRIEDSSNNSTTLFCIDVLLHNLEYSCNLWSKLSSSKEKEGSKQLVGESIFGIANLEGLNHEIYSGFILTKLLDLVLSKNDAVVQTYLIDCIIHAFPTELNLNSVTSIFSAISNLKSVTNTNNFVIAFIQRVENLIVKQNITTTSFDTFQTALDTFLSLNKFQHNKSPKDYTRTMDLFYNIIKCFIVGQRKLEGLNREEIQKFIINCFNEVGSFMKNCKAKLHDNEEQSKISNKLYFSLLLVFENSISAKDIPHFLELITYLTDENREEISIQLIKQMSKNSENPQIVSKEMMDFIIEISQPIFLKYHKSKKEDKAEATSKSRSNREYEISALCKISSSIDYNDIDKGYELLKQLYSHLSKLEIDCPEFFYSILNSFINLMMKLAGHLHLGYLKEHKYRVKKSFKSSFNLSNSSSVVQMIHKLYKDCKELIQTKLSGDSQYGVLCYLHFLSHTSFSISAIDKTKLQESETEVINEMRGDIVSTLESIAQYLLTEALDCPNPLRLIENTTITLFRYYNIIHTEDFCSIRKLLYEFAVKLTKRTEQTKAILLLLKLTIINFDMEVKSEIDLFSELLSKAIDYSEYAVMVSNLNISLMIDTLNLLISSIKLGVKAIKKKTIEKLIKKIRNIIKTIQEESQPAKSEQTDLNESTIESNAILEKQTKLDLIAIYFTSTIKMIEGISGKYEVLNGITLS